MIANAEVLLALRTRLLTLSVRTTGSVTLSATAAGYARTAGSFLADGFAVGMEVTPTGFTQTATGVVSDVTALLLSIAGGRTVQTSGAGRTVACLLPTGRAWENREFDPPPGWPWVEEEYLPGPMRVETVGPLAQIEALPQYVVKVYGPNSGAFKNAGISALYAYADAVLNLFPPHTALTLASGDVVRVRGDVAPYRSQLLQHAPGYAVVPVTIPLRVRSRNSI